MIPTAVLERDVVVVACAISAGVHAALAPAHLGESLAAGTGFLLAAALLVALAVAVTRTTGPAAPLLAAVVLAGLLGSYAVATTSGLPFLHPDPERLDALAVATKAVEAAGLVAALLLPGRGRSAVSGHLRPKGETR